MGWEIERLGFACGVLLAANYKVVNRWIHNRCIMKTVVLMIASGIVGMAYLKFKPVDFYGDYLLKIVLGIVLTAFVIVTTSGFRVGNRLNCFLGSISYEVYLLHEIAFASLIILVPRINSGVFIVVSIAITVLFGYGLKKLTERMMRITLRR